MASVSVYECETEARTFGMVDICTQIFCPDDIFPTSLHLPALLSVTYQYAVRIEDEDEVAVVRFPHSFFIQLQQLSSHNTTGFFVKNFCLV